jgi:hypothetical protein
MRPSTVACALVLAASTILAAPIVLVREGHSLDNDTVVTPLPNNTNHTVPTEYANLLPFFTSVAPSDEFYPEFFGIGPALPNARSEDSSEVSDHASEVQKRDAANQELAALLQALSRRSNNILNRRNVT